MKQTLIILLLTFGMRGQTASDAKHFYAGASISIVTGEVIYHYTDRNGLSCLTGIAAGIAAGAIKEYVYDGYFKLGVKNNVDFLITAQGAIMGGMFERCRQDWIESKRSCEKEIFEYKKHLLD